MDTNHLSSEDRSKDTKKHNMDPLCTWSSWSTTWSVCFFSVCSSDWHQALGDWPTGFPNNHDEDWSYQTFPVHRLPPQVQLIHTLTTSLFSSSHHMRMTHISHSKLSSQRSLFWVATWGRSQQTGRCFRGGDDYRALFYYKHSLTDVLYILDLFLSCAPLINLTNGNLVFSHLEDCELH